MSDYTALDVAKYFIQKAQEAKAKSERRRLSPLKLQKIVYYAQGWYVANKNKPLFKEKIWAWKHGPVVREVYDEFHRFGAQNLVLVGVDCTPSRAFDEDVKGFLDMVWESYSGLKADQLVDMTHSADPWIDAMRNPYSDEITVGSIQRYFSALLNNE